MTARTEIIAGLPIACRLMGPEFREREAVLQREVFSAVAETRELADGYALRFPGEAEWLATLAEFIRFERTCCPFLRFELHAEQQDGPFWLRLRGPAGAKGFIAALLGPLAATAARGLAALEGVDSMGEANKEAVRRLVGEVLNAGRLDVIDELYAAALAPRARRWIAPFRASFPDLRMDVVDLIAEGDTVVGWFRCSGTHRGAWRGHAPTGRRFERIDEVYIFQFGDGRIVQAWGLEDTLRRLEQLGLLASSRVGVSVQAEQ